MKKILSILSLVLITGIVISSCKKDRGDRIDPNALIDPGDANALTAVVVTPAGSSIVRGSLPAPTGAVETPVIDGLFSNVTTSNGSTTPYLYTYRNAISNLGGFYVQIEGASSYFNVPYSGTSSSSGQVNFPLGLPTNVDSGRFCLLFSVYDLAGHISNQVRVCASVIRLGTGALQVSLSWNTPTDQDLWVTDPSGTKIYYANKTSPTQGQLDRDDIDGYGPENIFWLSNAPDGVYKVQVNDYNYTTSPNTCYVTINAPGKSKSFTITTQNNDVIDVVTITKSGTTYNF